MYSQCTTPLKIYHSQPDTAQGILPDFQRSQSAPPKNRLAVEVRVPRTMESNIGINNKARAGARRRKHRPAGIAERKGQRRGAGGGGAASVTYYTRPAWAGEASFGNLGGFRGYNGISIHHLT